MFELVGEEFADADQMLLTASRLERLAANLRAIHASAGPTAEDLSNAPVIENWAMEYVPAKALFGRVASHLPEKYLGFCSTDLWVLAEPRGWVLTLERWYRLGRPEKLQN
ncbi:DUF6634 family protein [Microvirga splendida]|uniref:Uncharacterized protein n=1 Tax=Microvirga splendida TaxID=2795727 RepID=A0ABS0Y6P3_9HYPH|nr:DUF6634 family protein [Microvirga splendida]MBJ6127548.1 hypothetical protein [Microvirga splendida]